MLTAEPWVETGPCERATCDWSGMHWHWGARRFRSASELRPDELAAFDDDCRLTVLLRERGVDLANAATRELELAGIIAGAQAIARSGFSVADMTTAPAGRRQTERSTMPSEKRADRTTYGGVDSAPSMGVSAADMSEQESTDRTRLGDLSQWLGLLDAPRDMLRERVAGRPLGATTDDLRQIAEAQRFVGQLGSRLFDLHEGLRGAIAGHLDEHDARQSADAEKAYASDPRR